MIANTTGIDLFIDAHSHSELNEKVQQKHNEGDENVPTTLLVSTYCYGHNIGEIVQTAPRRPLRTRRRRRRSAPLTAMPRSAR